MQNPLAHSLLARAGRLVSVAEEPLVEGMYFVEPSWEQLIELARLDGSGELRVALAPENTKTPKNERLALRTCIDCVEDVWSSVGP